MAVMMILDWEGVTPEQYAQVNDTMGIHSDADAPDGLISHVAGIDERGELTIVDLWESEEALGRFYETRLGPALGEVGIPESQARIHPVHNEMHGSGEGNVLILIEVDDTGTDVYDRMAADMPEHTPVTPAATRGCSIRSPRTATASSSPTCGPPKRRSAGSPSSGSGRPRRSTAWGRCV